VSHNDADLLASSLRARRAPLVYLVYPDEGHGLARWQNRLSFYATAEQFLNQCLGGRAEPVGHAYDGASLQAFDGASRIPALTPFARRPAQPAPAPQTTGGETPLNIAPEIAPAPAPAPPPAAETSTSTTTSTATTTQ
jgi:hypothetical protein